MSASAVPPTVAQVLDAIRLGGGPSASDDGNGGYLAYCQICDPNTTRDERTLQITQNERGAHVECSRGCPPLEIEAYARAILTVAPAPSAPTDPLALVAADLEAADPVHLRGLQRVTRYGEDGDVIELHFDNGRVLDLGSAEQLQRQDHCLRRFARTGAYPDPLKAPDYRKFMRALTAAAEQREGAGSLGDEAADWLDSFARQHGSTLRLLDLTTTEGKLTAISNADLGQPFRDTARRLHVRPDAVARWLRRTDVAHLTGRELTSRLARLGFHSQQVSARGKDSETRKVRVWVSPPGFGHAVPTSPYTRVDESKTTTGDSGDSGDTYIESGKSDPLSGDSRGDKRSDGGSR